MKNINIIKSNKEYIDDFLPTLSNFCSKCPLQPTVDYVKNEGVIYITPLVGNQITVIINSTVDKHDVIRDIKNEMYVNYPIISNVEEIPLSSDEIEKLIDGGMSVKDALEKKEIRTTELYRVIRVHHRYNELDCEEIATKKLCKLKSRIPLTMLLNKLYSKDKDVYENISFMKYL